MRVLWLVLFLSACMSTGKSIPLVLNKDSSIYIDPRVLEPCKELTLLPANASFQDILEASIITIQLYKECKAKQDASIILLKKAGNVD